MTATSDERRDMARKLRELPIDVYEVEEMWESEGLNTDCHDQTDYYLIYFVLFGCLPADHMHPCDYEELHARLADLIEPEPERTCEIKRERHPGYPTTYGICSRCGALVNAERAVSNATDYLPTRFCPNCGAKVVS